MFADDYHGVTFIGNCCEPICRKKLKQQELNNENLGFVCIPATNGRKMDSKLCYYTQNIQCAGQCKDNICLHVFEINLSGNNKLVDYKKYIHILNSKDA